MTEITKADLHEFKTEIKDHIDQRFTAHEYQEKLMIEPLVKRVDTHSTILRGRDGDAGLVKDMHEVKGSIKVASRIGKWVGGGGLFAGVTNWLKDMLH